MQKRHSSWYCCCCDCCSCSLLLFCFMLHTHTYRETHAHLHFWHHLDARRATDANLIWTPHTKKCARERESAWQGDIPTWRRRGVGSGGNEASWPKGGYLRHNLRLSVYELQLMMLQALECAFLI